VDTLKLTRYVTDSENTKRLDQHNRRIIQKLLDTYEYLKLSSLTAEGLEESVSMFVGSKHKVLDKGKLYDIKEDDHSRLLRKAAKYLGVAVREDPAPASPASTQESTDMLGRFEELLAGDPEQEELVHQRARHLFDQARKRAGHLVLLIHDAIGERKLVNIRAGLELLARNKRLDEFFKHESTLRILGPIIEKQYGPKVLADYRERPGASPYVQALLRHLYEERLQVPESEAARMAITMANTLVLLGDERYIDLAYADEETRTFAWTPVAVRNDKLEIQIPKG